MFLGTHSNRCSQRTRNLYNVKVALPPLSKTFKDCNTTTMLLIQLRRSNSFSLRVLDDRSRAVKLEAPSTHAFSSFSSLTMALNQGSDTEPESDSGEGFPSLSSPEPVIESHLQRPTRPVHLEHVLVAIRAIDVIHLTENGLVSSFNNVSSHVADGHLTSYGREAMPTNPISMASVNFCSHFQSICRRK